MVRLNRLAFLGLIGLGLTTASSYGNTYDFSYNFVGNYGYGGAGMTVTGELDGTPVGSVVDVTGVLRISVDGVPLSGPFSLWSYSGDTLLAGGAVVATEVDKNNFGFSNTASTPYGDELFQNVPYQGQQDIGLQNAQNWIAIDYPGVQANWSLTPVATAPDGGFTIAMLGTAISGLAFIRRKL